MCRRGHMRLPRQGHDAGQAGQGREHRGGGGDYRLGITPLALEDAGLEPGNLLLGQRLQADQGIDEKTVAARGGVSGRHWCAAR
jgi:hypothetical protein